MGFRTSFGGTSHDRGVWLLFLVLLGVLAPTACVLWFMNEAVKSQADSAHQKVTEAYRGQLRFVRSRIGSYWETRVAAVQGKAGECKAADFMRIVTAGMADSVIFYKSDGAAVYPSLATVWSTDPLLNNPAWRLARALEGRRERLTEAAAAYASIAKPAKDASLAARAAQGRVRSLLQSGATEEAIRAIQEDFTSGPAAKGLDLHGRLIAADEFLLSIGLIKSGTPRYQGAVTRLAALLNDYERTAMPSTQRLFLMDEIRATKPEPRLPTYEAELLAARFLEKDGATPGDVALQRSRVADLWKVTSKNSSVVALYRTGTILSGMNHLLNEEHSSPSVRFAMIPPGAASGEDVIPAGPLLPGWQLSYSLLDTKTQDEVVRRRMASYLWVGFLVVATMAVTAVVAGRAFRRQARLASLKTDLVAAVSHELKTPLASMRVLVDALLADAQFDAQKVREYLQLMVGENMRLSRLIENFLTFSRIQRNRQKFEFADHKPADVTLSAVQIMRERYPMPENQPEVDISPGLPLVHVDKDAFVTALLNLLDNAYKYTPGDKQISVCTFREDGQVVFAVQDNGIGIAPREQKRIFRRFYRVDQRLARETGGCGLGLSIVEFIVKAHGGAVRVKSEPGAGSTFSVSLPWRGAEGRAA